MAEADTAPARARSKLAASDVPASWLQQVLALLFPSNLAAKAALFAVAVALLPLLPSSRQAAPGIWDLPHLLLLGVIVSYGVFGQKNAEVAEVAAEPDEPSVEAYVSEMMQGSFAFEQNGRDGDDGGHEDRVRAWSSQYLPDDPLVVVADNDGKGKMPLLVPVSTLKPAPDEVPATPAGDISDGIDEEEEDEPREFLAPKTGYYGDTVRERAIPSPSSVLDADDLTLSPSSPPALPPPPPPPPPFLGIGRGKLQKAKPRSFNEFCVGDRSTGNMPQQFRSSKTAVHAPTRSVFPGYDPAASTGNEAADDDDGELLDETVAGAASDDSSFRSDDDRLITDNDAEEDDGGYGEEADGDSCDEELIELATRPGPGAGEVDRKAEEFIAKFRDQIRMQRVVEPATTTRR